MRIHADPNTDTDLDPKPLVYNADSACYSFCCGIFILARVESVKKKSRDTDPFDILGENACKVCESSVHNADSACYSFWCGIFILARINYYKSVKKNLVTLTHFRYFGRKWLQGVWKFRL